MNTEEKLDRLDAYLDGQLDADEREAFERELENDPELKVEVERQGAIDDSIRRLFPAPPTERLTSRLTMTEAGVADSSDLRVVPASEPANKKSSPMRQWLGLAAAIGICVLAAIQFKSASELDLAADYSTMAGAYRTEVSRGFEPLWVCKDDAQFSGTFSKKFGQPLVLGSLPSDVRAIGLSYASVISSSTTFLLAEARGEKVIVFIDLATHGEQSLPDGSDLNLYSRQIGPVRLYEVSPLDQAYLLDAFRVPSE